MVQCIADGFLYCLQLIIAAVISSVAFRNGADNADTHGIKARIHYFFDAFSVACIGININLSLVCLSTNQLNACSNIVCCQRRLSLAALAKADNALWSSFQMIKAYLSDFLSCWPEFNTALR